MALSFPSNPSINDEYLADGSTWIWDGDYWIRKVVIANSIDNIGDVSLHNPQSGHFLRHDGTAWINDAVDLSTDTVGNYVEALVAGTGITITNNTGEAATPNVAVDTGTIATRAYVDAVAVGLYWHEAVKFATAGVLPNSPTYDNGTSGVGATLTATTNGRLVVDGGNATTGDRILVKNQSTSTENGLYVVTDQGSTTSVWIVTRADDSDNSINGEFKTGDAVYTLNGSANLRQGFVLTSYGSLAGNVIDIGSDSVEYTQFSGTASFTAGNGLTTTGNTLNVVTADSSRILANADSIDLATVAQTNTSGSNTTTFLSDITVDSFGRVTGKESSLINFEDAALLGTPTAPTASVGTNTTQIASTEYVKSEIEDTAITRDIISGKGSIIVGESYATPNFLAAGTDGYFLKANSSATYGIEWASIPSINNLDDVGDVSITSVSQDEFLKWNGTSWVNSSAGLNLNDIDNVSAATPSDGQFLKYLSASSNWQPADIPTINNLDDIGDVNVSSASAGDFLKWSGSAWINDPINLSTDTAGDYVQSLVQGTGITLTNNSGEGSTPTVAVDTSVIATKAYADSIAQGLHVHATVHAIATTSLATITGDTVTYDNGTDGVGATLTLSTALDLAGGDIDGDTDLATGDRIIIAGESNAAHNGIYVITSTTVLTRASDFDQPVEMAGGDFVFVTHGTNYADTGWVMSEAVGTVGVDNVPFVQFSGAGTYIAGTGLTLSGNEFSISSSVVTLTDIQTLTNKTITTPLLTLSTTTSTTEGRIAWDSTNDKIIVGDGSTAREFASSTVQTNQQTASYTLVLSDKDKMVEVSVGSANTITVPTDANVAYPVGTQIIILQTGAGQTTIAGDTGVTVNGTPGLKLRAQWSAGTLIKRGTDLWVAIGDLSA